MNWKNPFYVCEICGISFRKYELDRAKEKERNKRYQEDTDDDPQRKRVRDYEKWYLKQDD